MNRKNVPKGKLVRRMGVNIFDQPKYDKLLKKKPHGPGMQGAKKRRGKQTEYARQLLEKQKLKFAYGLSEKQFRNTFEKAKRIPGITGENMLILLERRLDNTVFRTGLAQTRAQARQMVSHGHIHLNGRTLNIPSALVRAGDMLSLKDREAVKKLARENLSRSGKARPNWIEFQEDNLEAKVARNPERSDIPTIANEQLVVELYAK